MKYVKAIWNAFIKPFYCKHEYEHVRNIHGDEINALNGKRSEWSCKECGKLTYGNFLHLITPTDEREKKEPLTLLDSAISEIKHAMNPYKSVEVKEHYLNNAIRLIKESQTNEKGEI